MPMDDFVCVKCGKLFELIIPLEDIKKEVKCKYCGEFLRKLFPAPYFKVK